MKGLTVLLTLLLAAPAQAGTIEVRTHVEQGNDVHTYELKAVPGEVNHVTVEPVGEGFRVTDTGAPVTGSVCPAGTCPEAYPLSVDLGDGDARRPVGAAQLRGRRAGQRPARFGRGRRAARR